MKSLSRGSFRLQLACCFSLFLLPLEIPVSWGPKHDGQGAGHKCLWGSSFLLGCLHLCYLCENKCLRRINRYKYQLPIEHEVCFLCWVVTATLSLVPHKLKLPHRVSCGPRALPWLRKQGTEIHRSLQSFQPKETAFLWLCAVHLCPNSLVTQTVLSSLGVCYRHRQQEHSTGLGSELMLGIKNGNSPSSLLANN